MLYYTGFLSLCQCLCGILAKKRVKTAPDCPYCTFYKAVKPKNDKSLDEAANPWYTISLVCISPNMSQLPLIVNGRIPI